MSRTPWAELGLTTALLLNACGPAKSSGTEKPVGGDGVGQTAENLPIPTPNVITNSEGEIRYPTETYFASKLNVCVAHPFSKTGGAEMPSILVSCKPIPNLEANEVVLRGDLVDIPENGFIAFTDNQGNDGYLNKETVMMSLQEIQTWVAGMSLSQVEKEVVGKVLGEARVTGENISVVFRQTLHTERDPNGDERLVDMGLSIGFQAGTKVSILDDTLQPFGKTDLLKDLQIAGVDVVANQVDLDEFILNVYPSDWVEVGDQRFVSPEFVMIMDQVAASGERFTLAPDGTIQDGAKTVPGLSVDKNGAITLQVNGESVTLDPAKAVFDDVNGVSYPGYTLDEATGLWRVEVVKEYPICTPENFRDCEIPVEELFDGTYFHWLEKQAKTLACSPNMRTDVKMVNDYGIIIPDPNTAPNFTEPGSEFFIRDHTAGFAKFLLPDGQEVHYEVMPLFICDLQDSTKLYPIIAVSSAYDPEMNQDEANRLYMGDNVIRWTNDMNVTPIIAGDKFVDFFRRDIQDPMVARTFTENKDMQAKFNDFQAGDFSALSKPGIVVLTDIATISSHWYE